MKQLNSQVNGEKIHLKAFPDTKSQSAKSLCYPKLEEFDHDCAVINDILRSKDMSDVRTENLPKKIMQIGITCQSYNLVKYMLVLFYRRPELSMASVKLTKL